MSRIFALCLWVFGALYSSSGSAQALRDTLPAVEKTASSLTAKEKQSTPYTLDYIIRRLEIDKEVLAVYKNDQLAKLLAQQLPVFVRTYGVNGPANLTLRGASAAQTSVQWNGVPMQNGATGLVDLLLIPVSVIDEVTISYGSSAGIGGNGSVGGTLSLNNLVEPSGASLSLAAGSFGQYIGGFKLVKMNKRWSGRISASWQQAENNFSYTDNGGTDQQLVNSRFSARNVQGMLSAFLTERDVLMGNIWVSANKREIPPALFESYSVKDQNDDAIRSLITYMHGSKTGRTQAGLNLSLFDEWFSYRDTAAAINSHYQTLQWYASPYLKTRVKSWTLNFSFPQQWNKFAGESVREIRRSAIAGEAIGRLKSVAINANGKAEIVNGKSYFVGGLNAQLFTKKIFTLRASAGYTYRTPTLNELYYNPGGNELLLPEKGYAGEAGYGVWLSNKNLGLAFRHNTTAFYRNINNWILWFGGAIWTPHNIARVVSQGIETENKLTWTRPKIKWQLTANGSYISSRTNESKVSGDGSIGRQIPYAPHWIGQGNFGFTATRWRFNYNQTYTGIRYYNTDETGVLDAYALSNMQAGYLWTKKHWSFDVSAQINNLWNHRYIEVSGRPAPGTNWQLGITVSESSPKK